MKDLKIAWFTEGGWTGKVPRNHPNMRNDMAWMHTLNVDHYPLQLEALPMLENVTEKYDLGIITIPKTNSEVLSKLPIMNQVKRICNRVAAMQEGPHWYFQDYKMEQQIWFYNTLMECDFIFCHNEIDVKYYSGLTGKPCYIMKTTMIEELIQESDDKVDGVMIGGNMCRWYGGFDSYIVAQQFNVPIYAPSMGRKIEREDEMDINHLPYMTWVEWIKEISRYKYGVHLMPTVAAGTFAMNCAYWGIPCIGYKSLDTQEKCFPELTVEMGDVSKARQLAIRLREDESFYQITSETAKNNYNKCFGEKTYIYSIEKILKEVMNESN